MPEKIVKKKVAKKGAPKVANHSQHIQQPDVVRALLDPILQHGKPYVDNSEVYYKVDPSSPHWILFCRDETNLKKGDEPMRMNKATFEARYEWCDGDVPKKFEKEGFELKATGKLFLGLELDEELLRKVGWPNAFQLESPWGIPKTNARDFYPCEAGDFLMFPYGKYDQGERRAMVRENAQGLFPVSVADMEANFTYLQKIHTQEEIMDTLDDMVQGTIGKVYEKTLPVYARIADKKEEFVTTTRDGKETTNTAKKGDYIVQNQTKAREEYVVKRKNFAPRYDESSARKPAKKSLEKQGYMEYDPIGKVRGVQMTETLMEACDWEEQGFFEASWGSLMRVRKDDYLVSPITNAEDVADEVYRIAHFEFDETYSELVMKSKKKKKRPAKKGVEAPKAVNNSPRIQQPDIVRAMLDPILLKGKPYVDNSEVYYKVDPSSPHWILFCHAHTFDNGEEPMRMNKATFEARYEWCDGDVPVEYEEEGFELKATGKLFLGLQLKEKLLRKVGWPNAFQLESPWGIPKTNARDFYPCEAGDLLMFPYGKYDQGERRAMVRENAQGLFPVSAADMEANFTCLQKIHTQEEIMDTLDDMVQGTIGKVYEKTLPVYARIADKKEEFVTTTRDGKETTNTAKKGDYIVQNQTKAREEYVVKRKNFAPRYDESSARKPAKKSLEKQGYMEYDPIGKVRGVQMTETLMEACDWEEQGFFEASWGSLMRVRKDDYLVSPITNAEDVADEIYRIAHFEFDETYSKVAKKVKKKSGKKKVVAK